jgi:hypothetical protein
MNFPSRLFERRDLFWNLFLYKLPYLFIDIGLGVLLSNLFTEIKKKKMAFIIWMFNPVTLYATFMIGQVDILPAFFSVLSFYLILKKKYYWGLLALGIGGSYKMYPLLFILPAAFILAKTFKERIKLLSVGFVPFVAIILPYLGSPAFRQMVLFSPKSQKMLFMIWPLSGAEGVYPFIFVLTIIYAIAYYSKKQINLGYYFLSILLLIFSVTHYHPQWFLWLTPFLIWELIENNFKHLEIILFLTFSWLFITLFFESSLNYGLFNPLWPNLVHAPNIADILMKYTDIFRLKSIVRSIFAGISFYYVYELFKKDKAYEQ